MSEEVTGLVLAPVMVLLAFAGAEAVLFDWLKEIHCPTFLALLIMVAIPGLALSALVCGCKRWPDGFFRVHEKTTVSVLSSPDSDRLPEFCTGSPAATIDSATLFFVASPCRRGEAYDTFVATFDRAANAWRNEAGLAVRARHADDRWLLHEENREVIRLATQRIGDAFRPWGQDVTRAC